MTIAISLKVNDGLILAADSASTLMAQSANGPSQVVNVYNNANKVFNLIKGLPVGAITWGAGSIGLASISTLAKDFRKRLAGQDEAHIHWKVDPLNYTVGDIAVKLKEFMYDELYVPAYQTWAEKPPMGFVVAGYSSGEQMAEDYLIEISGGACNGPTLLRQKTESGITWHGEPEAINRLLLGFGTALPMILENNLGVPKAQIVPAMQLIQQTMQVPLAIPAMPIQDAIDLVEFLVYLTIKFSRFTPGAPTVGGPIEIAAISKHEHFKWIKRKHYFSHELNRGDIP